jgi:hypothetical protein
LKRNNNWTKINGLLGGKDLFIVASGPSLKGFDFSRLKNRFTLAVNHTIEHYSDAWGLIFSDKIFLHKTSFDLEKYKGYIFCSERCAGTPPITEMMESNRENLFVYDDRRDEPVLNAKKGLYHPTSTGLGAINLGLQMRAGKIYLMGYDFKTDETGNKHFYPDLDHHKKYSFDKYLLKIKKFNMFAKYSHKIVNLNPDSAIEVFQYMNVEDVI